MHQQHSTFHVKWQGWTILTDPVSRYMHKFIFSTDSLHYTWLIALSLLTVYQTDKVMLNLSGTKSLIITFIKINENKNI